jgi:predicted MFS family arabinose efflux permease
LGEASYAVLAPAWLSDLFTTERRNNALTIFYAATPVGAALGYAMGGFSLDHGGWRYGFFWAGAPGLVLALGLSALTEPERGASDSDASRTFPAAFSKPGLGGILSLFRIRDYTLVLLGLTAYTFSLGAFAAWGPTFLNRVHGLELGSADQFFGGALVIGGLLGTFVGGFTASVWQRKSPAGYALLLTASASMTVLLATAAFVAVGATASLMCLGAAIFVVFLPTGPVNTLLIESVPITLRASAIATSIFVIHLFGDFWSAALVGGVADRWHQPDRPGLGLQHAMLVLPAVFCFAVFFWGWLTWRQRNQKRQEADKPEQVHASRAD